MMTRGEPPLPLAHPLFQNLGYARPCYNCKFLSLYFGYDYIHLRYIYIHFLMGQDIGIGIICNYTVGCYDLSQCFSLARRASFGDIIFCLRARTIGQMARFLCSTGLIPVKFQSGNLDKRRGQSGVTSTPGHTMLHYDVILQISVFCHRVSNLHKVGHSLRQQTLLL